MALRGIIPAVFAALSLASPALAQNAPQATIDSGVLSGVATGDVITYKGIPYAASPVGALRWQPPQPAAPWPGVRSAAEFGAICPQPQRLEGSALLQGPAMPQSEDCLTLNVWTFAGAKAAPVMVWIHGGGFRQGSGASRFYDGTDFAKDGVVLVTINYRLGALGFFAHPALTKAATPGVPIGNYGLMDQIAALQWVKRNIAMFGGDPSNVTVFGESAGGKSVLALMTTPAAHGLFAKAISESGGGWERPTTLADKEQKGVALATSAGLGEGATPDQLRTIPVDKLLAEPPSLGGTGPFVDGRLVTESITQAFAAGRAAHVPLIIGSNSYEASLMKTFDIPSGPFLAQLQAKDRGLYPANDEDASAALFTDSVMGGPARWVAGEASQAAPTYLYHFSYVASVRRGKVPGAQHGSEIPFVFGNWPPVLAAFASDDDRAMETRMHACWVAFAKTAKPECGGLDWPAYSRSADTLMEFGATTGPVVSFRRVQYDALQGDLLPRFAN